jgi:molybdopterin converting factor small subunit
LGELHVTFAGLVRRVVGSSEVRVTLPPGATLGDLLKELSARFGPEFEDYVLVDGEIAPHAVVLVDGQYAREVGGIDAPLDGGDPGQVEIVLLGPPLMGG